MRRHFKKLLVVAVVLLLTLLSACTNHDDKSTAQKTQSEGNITNQQTDTNQKDVDPGRSEENGKSGSDQNAKSDDQGSQSTEDQAPDNGSSNTKQNDQGSKKVDNQGQSDIPKGLDMHQVTALRLADPEIGWAGGDGWIAKTTNGGKNWAVQYQSEQLVHQLFALNKNEVWATFENSSDSSSNLRLLKSVDSGAHWSPVGRVPNNGFLHFISPSVAFSANARTLDGGKTWSTLSTPKNMVGNAYFHDQKNGWAVTFVNKSFQVERTVDGGKSWQVVMAKKTEAPLTNAIIRSAGVNDAWVECIGDSGMTQTSYSLFHTTDGGKSWQTVIVNSTAGGGPAPGFTMNDVGPHNNGSRPGTLYVVNTKVAYMSGQCPACEKSNTIGWTFDGGKTWVNGKAAFTGYGQDYLAISDAKRGWWVTTENEAPSVMYTTADGGVHWKKVYTFK